MEELSYLATIVAHNVAGNQGEAVGSECWDPFTQQCAHDFPLFISHHYGLFSK